MDSSEKLYFGSEGSYNKGRNQIENLVDFETGLIWTEWSDNVGNNAHRGEL